MYVWDNDGRNRCVQQKDRGESRMRKWVQRRI